MSWLRGTRMLDEIEMGHRVCNAWEAQKDLPLWLKWTYRHPRWLR